MDPVTRDNIVHALSQSLAFYGKKLDPLQARFWIDALRGHTLDDITNAIEEYHKVGKFAPRPAHILEIIQASKVDRKFGHRRTLLEDLPYTPCPTHIRDAWTWFIKLIAHGSNLEGMLGQLKSVDPETQERYLRIVNEEAKRTNTPDAIPFEYRLKEVWQ